MPVKSSFYCTNRPDAKQTLEGALTVNIADGVMYYGDGTNAIQLGSKPNHTHLYAGSSTVGGSAITVEQNDTNADYERPLLLAAVDDNTSGTVYKTKIESDSSTKYISAIPASGTLKAVKFVGNLQGNANSATNANISDCVRFVSISSKEELETLVTTFESATGYKRSCPLNLNASITIENVVLPAYSKGMLVSTTYNSTLYLISGDGDIYTVYYENGTWKTPKVLKQNPDALALTVDVGSENEPVYFKDGIPQKCTGLTIQKNLGVGSTTPLFTVGSSSTATTASPLYIGNAGKVAATVATYPSGLADYNNSLFGYNSNGFGIFRFPNSENSIMLGAYSASTGAWNWSVSRAGNAQFKQVTADTFSGTATTANTAYKLYGEYTGSGGMRPPSSVGDYSVKCSMMKKLLNTSGGDLVSFSSYADVLMMNAYTTYDESVAYCTALAINKNTGTPRAWIANGISTNTKGWSNATEIVTKANITSVGIPIGNTTYKATLSGTTLTLTSI